MVFAITYLVLASVTLKLPLSHITEHPVNVIVVAKMGQVVFAQLVSVNALLALLEHSVSVFLMLAFAGLLQWELAR